MIFRMLAPPALRALVTCLCAGSFLYAAEAPTATISNGTIKAKLYLPDSKDGYYRGTRFDWSGVINSLEYAGHNFYGPWFTKSDPTVRDFAYQDSDIAVGIPSGSMGPAEEFQTPLGYDTAKAGETFIKVGVGVLRKDDETPYNNYKHYEIADPGKWTVKTTADSIEFTQELASPAGFGYRYRKTIRLVSGKPQMTIEHSLRNTGKLAIKTRVYDHNFLVLDHLPTGDYTVTVPYEIKSTRAPDAKFAEIHGKQLAYVKTLENQERLTAGLQGFGADASDYDFRIDNKKAGVGMRIQGDRPLQSASLWSIRSVMAVEPFIDIPAEPGQDCTWSYTYTYYTLPK